MDNPSSTTSFRHLWQLIPFKIELTVVLLTLLAAEGLLRFPSVRALLPGASIYYYEGVSHLLDKLERRQHTVGSIDVIFIGSSISRTNLDPRAFEQTLADYQGCNDLSAFNLSLSGSPLSNTRFYLEHIWPDYVQPRYILLGLRYTDFIDAVPELKPSFVDGPLENLIVEDTPHARRMIALMNTVELVRYHGSVGRFIQFPSVNFGRGKETDDLGYERRTSELRQNLELGLFLETSGYNEDENLIFTTALNELRTMHRLAQAQGAQFVVINMPEHPDRWQQPNGPTQYRNYVSQIQALADELGFLFIDVTDGDPFSSWADLPHDRIYSDYHHMNEHGAQALTRLVAVRFKKLCATRP